MGSQIGYIRVSTLDQNTERQLDGMALDKVFEDKASGKDIKRPQLAACLEYLREGDTLVVHSIDRLARNLEDLQRLVRELTGKGVSVRFLKESLTFEAGEANPMQTLMFQMLGAFAQFERALIRERQREGITLAKKEGRQLGRAKALTAEQEQALRERVAQGANKKELAAELGVSRQTLYRYLGQE
ncbi:recombinase family protein [Desulfovibrio sp. OttesenSCG-928-O18]|nr:recombinase family protein [Desulfovibrio sp. OttesenSCG-928-O18]